VAGEVECHVPPEIVATHKGEGHELEVEAEDVEVDESGGGRYQKNIITATIHVKVRCSCQTADQKDPVWEGDLKAEVAAGDFDECC